MCTMRKVRSERILDENGAIDRLSAKNIADRRPGGHFSHHRIDTHAVIRERETE